ncbi:hypothetical protein J6590_005842 [Homalodisca vitripennis]|nr:hypothetical protein J6590_005842 [Homalodisca vitripennis]
MAKWQVATGLMRHFCADRVQTTSLHGACAQRHTRLGYEKQWLSQDWVVNTDSPGQDQAPSSIRGPRAALCVPPWAALPALPSSQTSLGIPTEAHPILPLIYRGLIEERGAERSVGDSGRGGTGPARRPGSRPSHTPARLITIPTRLDTGTGTGTTARHLGYNRAAPLSDPMALSASSAH